MKSKYIVLLMSSILYITNTFSQLYNPKYIQHQIIPYNGESYSIVDMSRKDGRVKVKYFAAKDNDGSSVKKRFLEWSKNKNVILYTSGTYMTSCDANLAKPDGLCIDAGKLVNQNLSSHDGLVIVQATGGIVASNLKEGNLTVSTQNAPDKTLNLKNSFDRIEFYKWAENNEATVFQTHLLYYKNQLKIANNSSQTKAKRRLMVVGKDENGILHHYIVYLFSENTLKSATEKIVDFVKVRRDIDEIVFIINLDTGCQDVYEVWNSKGSKLNDQEYKGQSSIDNAANLLVYYFE
jgi:hypothetical protein